MAELRSLLDQMRARLRSAHRRGEGGLALGARVARFWDKVLADLFAECGLAPLGASLLATGSLGREQASPWSDVDFLVLLPDTADAPAAQGAAEGMLYPLYDARVKTGQSFATIDQALARAAEDSQALTALLDARRVAGDATLAGALFARIDAAIAAGDFAGRIERKIPPPVDPEYPPTIHTLEPNLKDSPGGLRDYQLGIWNAQARWGRQDVEKHLVEHGVMSPVGWTELSIAVDFLLRVRHEIQFRNRGVGDVLKTAVQPEAAILLGYQGAGEAEAAKALLKDYFAAADRVQRFTRRMGEMDIPPEQRTPRDDIAPGASVSGDLVFLTPDPDTAWKGAALVRLFTQFAGTGLLLAQRSAARLADMAAFVDDEGREDAATAAAFLDLLNREWAGDALRAMHSTGWLGAYIPPFGGLRGLVPYDVFHSYPADEHTLIAIGFFDRLRAGMGPDDLVEIARRLFRPDLVRLALLLHDVGKVGGPGHLDRGARLAPVVTMRLGLGEDESEFVVRLVREHEALSRAAHTRDIEDPAVAREAAERAGGDARTLDALYVMTYCDMRAVGPGVWNQWRADLLAALYERVRGIVERGRPGLDRAEVIARIREAALREHHAESVERYLDRMEREHPAWLSVDTALRHLEALRARRDSGGAVIRIHALPGAESWGAVLCADDRPGLLASAAGVFASEPLGILSLQALSTTDGVALDSIEFLPPASDIAPDALAERLTSRLRAVLSGAASLDELVTQAATRRFGDAARPHLATDVRIDNHGSDRKTVVEVWTADRAGLLYRITRALTSFGLSIHLAKINTIAGRAIDSFYVTDDSGSKITGRAAQELRGRLLNSLSS